MGMDYAGYNKGAAEFRSSEYAAHPDWAAWQASQPTPQEQMGGFGDQTFTAAPEGFKDPHQGYINTLTPAQQMEYRSQDLRQGAKMDTKSKLAMMAFLAAAGGGAATSGMGAGAATTEAAGTGSLWGAGVDVAAPYVAPTAAGAGGGASLWNAGVNVSAPYAAPGATAGGSSLFNQGVDLSAPYTPPAGPSVGPLSAPGGADALGSWGPWGFDPSQLLSGLGGGSGSFLPSTAQGWLGMGSGIYGMYLAEQQRKLAKQAISGSAPWTASGGTAMAGDALKHAISGDLSQDPGFQLAQNSAARASAQQPGGFASMSAANAALKFQNDRINTLSGPAGVGFNPGAGYGTALGGTQMANQLTSSSLASIGYGAGSSNQMPPWLQAYLIKNGLGG